MPQFTKKAIISAFEKLLQEKRLESITVKDIVEECGVNRKTFYYYFSDIYDLTEQLFYRRFIEYLESENPQLDIRERTISFFYMLAANKKAIYHVYSSKDRRFFEKYLNDILKKALTGKLKEKIAENVKETYIEKMALVFTYIISGCAMDWLDEGMKSEPAEIIVEMLDMLEGTTALMLKNYGKNKS